MATGLLALLDDVATLLDDVSVMSKIAAKKTAGIVGDDLAVGAEQVSGINPKRELPIVWQIAKGSLINKCFLVPGALILGALAPWLIAPILIFGGVFLCFEGFEKVLHSFQKRHKNREPHAALTALGDDPEALKRHEDKKIKGAVRTDLILSAEIIAITLATVSESPFVTQALTLVVIALGITVVVYGLVAAIVKFDDFGLLLKQRGFSRSGQAVLDVMPYMMKAISVIGTTAMFLVGGGILTHKVGFLKDIAYGLSNQLALEGMVATIVQVFLTLVAGMLAGALVVAALWVMEKTKIKAALHTVQTRLLKK